MRKELKFAQGSGNPAFVIMYPTFPEKENSIGDYMFAYDPVSMSCIGATQAASEGYSYVAIQGDDSTTPEEENIPYGSPYSIGYYDSLTDKFYAVKGDILDYQTNLPTELVLMPFALARINNAVLGEEIQLVENTNLTETSLSITLRFDEWDTGDTETIPVQTKGTNITTPQVYHNGKGTLSKCNKFIHGYGWYYYEYTISKEDTNVIFNAVAQDIFDSPEMLTAQDTLRVNYVVPVDPPDPDPTILYEEERFRLVVKPFRTYGSYLFVESDIEETIKVQVMFTTPTKSTLSTGAVGMNDGRIYKMTDVTSIKPFRLWVDGVLEYLNVTAIPVV